MGDIFHALPVAYDIKKAYPDAELHWVVEESFKEAAQLSPYIDHLVVTAFRRWRKSLFSAATRAEIAAVKNEIRDAGYDIVVDIQGIFRSGLVASWSDSPKYGYSFKTIREPLAALFYDYRYDCPKEMGAVRRYRKMASLCLGYRIDEDRIIYDVKPTKAPKQELKVPFAILATNTSQPRKLWKPEYWVEVGRRLLKEHGLVSVFCWGSPAEKSYVESIATQVPQAIVLDRCSIGTLAATMAPARLCVGLDTGVTHLAATLSLPCVGLLVDSPMYLGPVSAGATVNIRQDSISVDEVMLAVSQVL